MIEGLKPYVEYKESGLPTSEAPKGRSYHSPGQRPGLAINRDQALKGRPDPRPQGATP